MQLIKKMSDLEPGDIMFGPIHGLTGAGVGAAQLVLAMAEPGMIWKQGPGKWFRIRHVGGITERAQTWPGSWVNGEGQVTHMAKGPMMVQAMPGGIEEVELDDNRWNPEYFYVRPDYKLGQAERVAAALKSYVGRPYDFATYGAIPLYRRGIQTARIKKIISDTDTMMCSRTVDAALAEAGWHLFDDGRLPGNVTPSELYRRILQMPRAAMTMLNGRNAALEL